MYALIIDDSRAMRRILSKIVMPLGLEVVEAENGQDGLDSLEEMEPTEVILVDWNMQVMNGLDCVKTVRADGRYANQKIMMVTTETEPAQMVRALMAGVDEFAMKPFTADVLVEKMKLIGVRLPNPVSSNE